MPFPIRECVVCGREFELRPDKPGFASRCPSCSEPDEDVPAQGETLHDRALDAERRKTMRNLLYSKDS